jgi:hypothetical protein
VTDHRLMVAARVVHQHLAAGADACWICKGDVEHDPPCVPDPTDLQIAADILAAIDAAGLTTASGLISEVDAAAARGVQVSSMRQLIARTRGPGYVRALPVDALQAWTVEHPPSPYHRRRNS